ncbi:SKP1-like protein 14-like [Trifolium medium]|uniref:SKP1-like protein 14-like n=1 Tax=Trifolium medium TaxID=97028 RepID=A0A392P5B1_9FABA|nr:SKP1-like protein 14-like [Trifolium medium]
MMAQKASSSASPKKFSLKTADGDVFEIEAAIAKQMTTVQDFIDKDENIVVIPLSNVFNKELSKIIEYCEKCVTGEITKDFEMEYVKDLSDDEVKVLGVATYHLNEEAKLREELAWTFIGVEEDDN